MPLPEWSSPLGPGPELPERSPLSEPWRSSPEASVRAVSGAVVGAACTRVIGAAARDRRPRPLESEPARRFPSVFPLDAWGPEPSGCPDTRLAIAAAPATSRAVHELAHRAIAQAEVVGDLGTALPLHRDSQERLALAIGERGDAGQRLAHHGAPLEVGFGGVRRVQRFLKLVVVVSAPLEGVERRVVRDPVQRTTVALDDGLERALVAVAGQRG